MQHDQFGRTVSVGDTVTLNGTIIDLLRDDPNYINCTVLLAQQMPPSGSQTRIDVNTQQVTKAQAGDEPPQPSRVISFSRLEAQRQAQQAAIGRIHIHLSQCKQILQQWQTLLGQT